MICWRGNTFMSHGTVDGHAKVPEIERGTPVVVAWHCRSRSSGYPSRECGISLREAYRYLEEAQAIGRAVPVAEPLVAATLKIPGDVLRQLRAYSATSGLTLKA